ncbi:DUF2783 domain-containing protein [Breoghania sp.]|uniref:DUF2783 domain-containing protein n=1 Tax=Breoghania sp. TaxID=2065378 RepID=UPI0029CAA981|nr:DUF2783 domain-containing protein [Breoghania sp.]
MSDLITALQLPDPDAAYHRLVDAHRGLSEEQSADLNARLVLLLTNHVGDLAVLDQAIELAKAKRGS